MAGAAAWRLERARMLFRPPAEANQVKMHLRRLPMHIRLRAQVFSTMVRTYYKVYVRAGRQLCLVYQMGKVASSSVANAIETQRCYRQFQVHRLNPHNIDGMNQRRANRGLPPLSVDVEGRIVYTKFIRRREPCKIVTLVREPVGRNISAFFQNTRHDHARENESSALTRDALVQEFLREYSHDTPLVWFDNEMRFTTGIDVYDYYFPKEEGYMQIECGVYQLLIMRHDLCDETKVQTLNAFLGTTIKKMCSRNVGAEKKYKDGYATFIRNVRLPKAYLDRMLQSRYCRHFYSEDEIMKLYAKYMKEDEGGK